MDIIGGAPSVRAKLSLRSTGESTRLGKGPPLWSTSPRSVVSIGRRGNDVLGRVEAMTELLHQWVADHPDWELAGDPRTMGFNSPMVRGDRRFFEVQLPVRPAQPEEDTAEAGMPEPQLRKI